MITASKLIDADALLKVVWASLAAGVGGTAAFSIAIAGATRFAEMRREGHAAEAAAFALVAAIGLGVCVAAVVLGLYVIIDK
jgi:TRAP-type C4-dicarboxylate transport system permease large subunit